MSALILVVVGIVAGALIVGVLATALLWSWHRRKRALPAPTPVPLLNAPAPRFGIGGFSLGDVVLFDQTETWLTAALRIQDAGNEEATLFFSERSADNDVLLLRLRPELTTFRVHPISLPGAGVGPATLEYDQEIFTRVRLIPVMIERHGKTAPDVGSTGAWSWFESASGDIIGSLHTDHATLTFHGHRTQAGEMMHLAAEGATFRDEEF